MPDPKSNFDMEAHLIWSGILSEVGSTQRSLHVEVEHLLWAILSMGNGNGAKLLEQAGINLNILRVGVQREVINLSKLASDSAAPQGFPANVYLTPRLQQVFSNAEKERQRLKHSATTPKHFLLAIAYVKEDKAAQLLALYGATYEKLSKLIENVPNTDKPFGL